MRVLTLLALTATLPLAAQQAAMSIGYGVGHRVDDTARGLVDSDGFDALDGGRVISLGFSAPERAFVGYPWFDIDWAHDEEGDNRFDTVTVFYVERVDIWRMWVGGGVGTVYNNVKVGASRDEEWGFGAKAVVGITIGGPLAVEAAYTYADTTNGQKMDYYSLVALLRF